MHYQLPSFVTRLTSVDPRKGRSYTSHTVKHGFILVLWCKSPHTVSPPKKVEGYSAMATFTGMKISPVAKCVFSVPKRKCICWLCTPFFGMNTNSQKNLKYPMTWQLIFQAFIFFLRQKKQWSNSFKCFYLKWTDDPVEQNWLKCLGCSRSRLTNSAQQVPEPDQLPGISFDTRPNLIQFWKSSGSPKHRDSQTPMFPNTKIV